MAENQGQEKTEKATPRRIRKAREKGDVAQSREVHSGLVLFIGLFTLVLFRETMVESWGNLFRSLCSAMSQIGLDSGKWDQIFKSSGKTFFLILVPLFIAVILAGIVGTWSQIGVLFQTQSLTPDIKRLNPFSGLKRIFSERILTEGIKTLFKLVVLGIITAYNIRITLEDGPRLIQMEIGPLVSFMWSIFSRIALHCFAFMIVVSIVDFILEKKKLAKKLMMTRKELKDENKEVEGNPHVKAKIKKMMKKLSGKRMMEKIPDAQVVVTNPTHFAVAIEYKTEMKAPMVVAKGAGLIAQKIKEKAKEAGVPIVENKPLARLLHRWVESGDEIPASMYQAVAEVLAYIFQLDQKKKWGINHAGA